MSTWLGDTLTKTASEPEFDPEIGEVIRETYVGNRGRIDTLAGYFISEGIRFTRSNEGPVHTLVAMIGTRYGKEGDEVPVDSYTVTTEMSAPSIWRSERVLSLAGSMATLNTWRRQIEGAIKGINTAGVKSATGGPLSEADAGFTGDQLRVYRMLVLDETSTERARVVLKRLRTCSPQYTGRMLLNVAELTFTAAQLETVFSVPASITALLPTAPTASPAPDDHEWAWKIRKQEWDVDVRRGRIRESIDWMFAAWNTVFYPNYVAP